MIQRAEEITIRVDPQAASVYRSASDDERQRLDMLLSLRLSEATSGGQPLQQLMQDISRRAQKRGLTPEALKSMLDEQ